MILAIEAMDPVLQAVFYTVAVILFVIAAFGVATGRVAMVPLGLAFFATPFAWNALAAA
jgi:hypothetical protein